MDDLKHTGGNSRVIKQWNCLLPSFVCRKLSKCSKTRKQGIQAPERKVHWRVIKLRDTFRKSLSYQSLDDCATKIPPFACTCHESFPTYWLLAAVTDSFLVSSVLILVKYCFFNCKQRFCRPTSRKRFKTEGQPIQKFVHPELLCLV